MKSQCQDTLYAKMAMPDSQRYPLYLYLINNVEDSLSKFKTFQSDNSFKFSCRNVTFVEKTQLNQISFQNYNI